MSRLDSYAEFLDKLRLHGSKVAILDSRTDDKYSYEELSRLSIRLTDVLKKQELRKGDRLLLYAVSGIDWVPLFLAAQLVGVVVVPVDTRVSSELLHSMVKKTKPKLIVNDADIRIDTKVKTVQSKQLIEAAKKSKKNLVINPIDASNAGQILLTSGTWSDPKGVSLRQSNVLENMQSASKAYNLDKNEVLLSILPLSHAYEQMCGLHMPLLAGCKIVYIDEITGDKIKSAIKKYKVSLIVSVPRILDLFQKGILHKIPDNKLPTVLKINKILRYAPVSVRRKFFAKVHAGLGPSLKTLAVGGAPLSLEVDKFFQGLGYKTLLGYGLSETSPIISLHKNQYGRKQGDVGQVLDNIEFKINKTNELLVRGPSVFAGYYPESRKDSEWFNTGDLVVESNRQIRLMGRSKNLIVFANGDKVTAEEIEHKIDSLPSVEENIVLSHDTKTGTSKGITIVYKSKKDLDKSEVHRYLASFLPTSARLISIKNIHPELLDRTHTMKLARKNIHKKFISQE